MTVGTFTLNKQKQRVGETLGVSDWVLVTQDMINTFGEVTLDPDPMHMDPDWCKANSPYVNTVAFGFLTTSLLTHLIHQVMPYDKHGSATTGGYGLNYGFDRLRYTGPVPVDRRIRAHFKLNGVRERAPGELIQTLGVSVEVEGEETPALVADWLFLWVTDSGHGRIQAEYSV